MHEQITSALSLSDLPETVGQEHIDRKNRLARLTMKYNAPNPTIENDMQIAGIVVGASHPVPAMRIVYRDSVFFEFGSSVLKKDAVPIVMVMAEMLKRDMPDTKMLLLGHTDSVGDYESNQRLSLMRAASVMNALIQLGVQASQLSTVGIGEMQPQATNATEEGRARNRRVEFVVSRYEAANTTLIERTVVRNEYLNNHVEVVADRMADNVKIKDGSQTGIEVHRPVVASVKSADGSARVDLRKDERVLITLREAESDNVMLKQ